MLSVYEEWVVFGEGVTEEIFGEGGVTEEIPRFILSRDIFVTLTERGIREKLRYFWEEEVPVQKGIDPNILLFSKCNGFYERAEIADDYLERMVLFKRNVS